MVFCFPDKKKGFKILKKTWKKTVISAWISRSYSFHPKEPVTVTKQAAADRFRKQWGSRKKLPRANLISQTMKKTRTKFHHHQGPAETASAGPAQLDRSLIVRFKFARAIRMLRTDQFSAGRPEIFGKGGTLYWLGPRFFLSRISEKPDWRASVRDTNELKDGIFYLFIYFLWMVTF